MPDTPNVLLIFTDQHRLSAVGAYGETPCRTPNLDRMAEEGVRFETAYTVCPVCTPARGTIMTGLYPHSHGMVCNTYNIGCSIHNLADRPTLLSRRLQDAGYRCGYSGKWHLGGPDHGWPMPYYCEDDPITLPKDVGFDGQNFHGHGGGGHRYPEYAEYLKANGFTRELIPHADSSPLKGQKPLLEDCPVEATVPYFLTQNTIDLMEQYRSSGDSFFIWHNFWGPHGPYHAPREYYDMYRDVEIPPWPNYDWPAREIPGPHQYKLPTNVEELTWDHWQENLRFYYAFTTLIDAQIGRMLKYLEDSGLAENTVVIFTSDHGETCGSHGGLTDKGYIHFEETHRIPMILRLPHGRHAGTVRQESASNADVYPTVLDLAGAKDVEGYKPHGRSLVPLIEGTSTDWRDVAVTEFHGLGSYGLSQRTIRHGKHKYGYNCGGTDELYDLEKDPWETINRIDDPDYKEVARDLRNRLLRWMKETGDDEARFFRNARHGAQGSWDV